MVLISMRLPTRFEGLLQAVLPGLLAILVPSPPTPPASGTCSPPRYLSQDAIQDTPGASSSSSQESGGGEGSETAGRQETQSYTVWPDMEEMLKDVQCKRTLLDAHPERLELIAGDAISRRKVATQTAVRTYTSYEDIGGHVGRDDAGPCGAGYPAGGDYDRAYRRHDQRRVALGTVISDNITDNCPFIPCRCSPFSYRSGTLDSPPSTWV
jgi:hypothetical protein